VNQPTENRLRNSASPYLRSAAQQPVDWHEWGEEAFRKAQAEQKPILLDIGAVWCHWCHVIDRESYEDPEIAAMINQLFVPVKVDRDERPDVDARYQAAVSAISGQGGWPLTAFLTPDGKPFFGGTYFPPDDSMGRPGFRRILLSIAEVFETRRKDVDNSAQALEEAVAKAELHRDSKGAFDSSVADSVVESALRTFDEAHGGFGHVPKFPHTSAIDLIIERYQATRDPRLLHTFQRTLEGMALGGVHDQVGGGFHRYSVDERWCVPHFEKMAYDNSELLKNFLHGYQVTGNPLFLKTAEGIVAWVTEVLSDQKHGGFYASQDADQTLDDDGDYFTWTPEELRAVLSPEELRAMELYFDVQPLGEMHHNSAKNVLWVASSAEAIASALKISADEALLVVERAKNKLLEARRQRRPTPAVDQTLYVSWNAMFVSAYLEAANVLGRRDCRDFALRTLDLLMAKAWDESRGFLHRVGGPRLEGTLDDQVLPAAALLDAFEITLDCRYFDLAERTMQLTIERFGDPDAGGFFDRARDAPPMRGLEVRRKPLQDSSTPGANPVAAIVLDRLHSYTGDERYFDCAQRTLEAFARVTPQYGLFAATYGLAALLHARHPLQVVVTGPPDDPKAMELEKTARGIYRFGKSVLRIVPGRLAADRMPRALRETLPHLNASLPQAFVCVGTVCHPPVTESGALQSLLGKR